MKVLGDLTVVSFEQAVAAPLASRHLADLGARVIKVERPEGDFARYYDGTVHGVSSYFAWLNRSKLSLTLDLKSPHAPALVERLTRHADVVIQNLGPSTLDRLGYDLTAMRRDNPRLVTCSISGYGDGGPYTERKAYDLLLQAESGLVAINGSPEAPARVGISIGDIAAGMYAFTAILAALIVRGRTGSGTHVEVTILEALAEWLGAPWYHAAYGEAPVRAGTRHPTIAPYGEFRCGDGKLVFLSIQNEREWKRLCSAVLGRPALATDPRFVDNPSRVAHREPLRAAIEARLATSTSDRVKALLERARIAYADLRSVVELAEHPQLVARHRLTEVASRGGPVRAFLPPFDIAGVAPTMGAIPEQGEHTYALLQELGYSETEIAALRNDAAVGTAQDAEGGAR